MQDCQFSDISTGSSSPIYIKIRKKSVQYDETKKEAPNFLLKVGRGEDNLVLKCAESVLCENIAFFFFRNQLPKCVKSFVNVIGLNIVHF